MLAGDADAAAVQGRAKRALRRGDMIAISGEIGGGA
jgi:hypothetical protein